MPQLPGIQDQPQSGEPVSAASVEPTDLGLTQAAANLQPVARLLQQRDAAAVQPHLEALQEEYGRQFAQASAQYDGATPGWAKTQIADFDAMAQRMTPQDLPWGQRIAFQRGIASLRASYGKQAVSTEVDKAGHYVADQQRASDDNVASQGYARFQEEFGQQAGAIDKAGGYALPDYAQQRQAAFEQAASHALESVPEANRPALQLKIDAERSAVQAETLHAQALGVQLQSLATAQDQVNRLANAVRSDPNRTTSALSNPPNLAGVAPEEAAKLRQSFPEDVVAARMQGLADQGHTDTALAELNGGQWDAQLRPERKQALIEAVKLAAKTKATDILEAFHWGGAADLGEAARQAQTAGDPGLAAEADWRALVGHLEPSVLNDISMGTPATGFQHAFDFTVDKLEGGAQVAPSSHGGSSKFGIDSNANPGVDIAGLTRGMAQGIAKKYWLGIGGDSLPPDLALAAFATAYNMGVGPTRELIAQSGNDTGKFLALAQARYRQIAAADPDKAPYLKGWLNRLDAVKGEAARIAAFVNVQDGVAADPIKYALGDKTRAALAQVAPMPQDPTDPAFAQALKNRLQVGQSLNARYHAPLRMLTNAEAADFKAALERDPTVGIRVAQAALPAIGPANTRALLGELGLQGASAQLHVADLAAAGLTTFPQSAAAGLAKGEALKADAHKEKALQQAFDNNAALFAGNPGFRAVTQAAAEAALKADTAQGSARDPNWYFDSSLGGATLNGVAYGGVARVNGAPVIIPPWLAKDRAGDAIKNLVGGWAATGKGPVWPDGQPLAPADAGKVRLQVQANGHYRFVDGQGRWLGRRGGGPFEIDLDAPAIPRALKAALGPQAVRGSW